MYGDIGKRDNEDEELDIKEFDPEHYTLDYDTIFRCYTRAQTIAQRNNLDEEGFKDTFFDQLLQADCAASEIDEIVEGFNPA